MWRVSKRHITYFNVHPKLTKAFGIKVPVEAWTQEVNAGSAPAEKYFVMKNLAERVDELVAAKAG